MKKSDLEKLFITDKFWFKYVDYEYIGGVGFWPKTKKRLRLYSRETGEHIAYVNSLQELDEAAKAYMDSIFEKHVLGDSSE